jgi:hypothetical protein
VFGSNAPSLLEQKLVLEQHSITFGANTSFGATIHHFWSKSLLWSNTPSLLEQKLVLEQPSITFRAFFVLEQHSITFGAKACLGATLLEQKLVLEQRSITFGAKSCFGATLHHF